MGTRHIFMGHDELSFVMPTLSVPQSSQFWKGRLEENCSSLRTHKYVRSQISKEIGGYCLYVLCQIKAIMF